MTTRIPFAKHRYSTFIGRHSPTVRPPLRAAVIHANVELALFLRSGETSWTNKTLVTSWAMAIGFLVFDRSLACLWPTYHFSWRTNTKQRGCKPGPSNGICWMTFLSKRSTSDSETCGSPEWFLVLSAGAIIVVLTSLLIRIRPPARK